MPGMTPLFINLAGRPVVIVGGGSVGERKARFFREAEVSVISPTFTRGLERMGAAGELRLIRRKVTGDTFDELFAGAFLVVATTDDIGLNAEVYRFCREHGILVNAAAGPTDVVVPSMSECGEIAIAVSTGGRSPAMARRLRRRLEAAITDDDRAMVRLQEALRARLKPLVGNQQERERLLSRVLEDERVWAALKVSESRALELALQVIDARSKT